MTATDDAPTCRNRPDGRSDCGRPSDPTSATGWCVECQEGSR